ncbi:helix-turn-helix domain-containing protein [Vibrio thalassae]|nr:AraC family transcriptional regulator [Vibrio thalassae]
MSPHRAECLKESQISLLKVPSHSTIKDITVLTVTPLVTQLFSVLKKAVFEPTLVSQYVDVLVDQCSYCEPSNQPLVAQGVIERRMLLIIEALSGKPNIKMSISELSKQTGASVRTLNRLFLTHFQASFKDIRNKVVMDMERAEQMIKQGTSATTVAYELKYSSLSSFSTAYSQHQKNKT